MKTFKLDAEIAQKTQNVNFCGFQFRTIGPDSLEAFLKECAVGEKVKIEINSPGGSVIAGLAMANMVKNSKSHVIAHVVGIAASMASVVACACDEIQMEEAAFLMIHNPWSEAEGDAEDMRHAADVLESMEEAMRAFYRGKFPQMTDAELDQLMAEETWMTGADCKARGMVCELVPSDVRAAACVTRRHFKKMPEAAAKFMEIHEAQPVADAPQPEAATEPVAAAAPQGEPVAAAQPEATEPQAENWEARYKGAMRKMSEKAEELARMRAELDAANHSAEELRAALESSNAALAASNATMESAKAQIEDLNSQLGACRGDLEKAKADLSGVTERAEKAEKELARKGEQLSTLEKAHALLTAGVLKPGGETVTSASGRTPEEREAIRKAARKNRR